MKAKFGKLSVGCFVVFWIFVLMAFIIPPWPPGSCPNGQIGILFGFLGILTVIAGIVCGIIGAIKRENPKGFYIIGLCLNVGYILFMVCGGLLMR